MNKNIIIVSGTGQNVGKTTFVCLLINKFKQNNIIGLKVSPHFHPLRNSDIVIEQNVNFQIILETETLTNKDSARMLKAGAAKVFYIQCTDDYLTSALQLLKNETDNYAVIIESGAFKKYYEPGLSFLTDFEIMRKKMPVTASEHEIIVNFNGNTFDFNINRILFSNKNWQII